MLTAQYIFSSVCTKVLVKHFKILCTCEDCLPPKLTKLKTADSHLRHSTNPQLVKSTNPTLFKTRVQPPKSM